MGQRVGCLHQELTTGELQGLVTAQSWPVVPLQEASRQGGQWGKDPSPSRGKTFLEELAGDTEHGHPMAATEDSFQ